MTSLSTLDVAVLELLTEDEYELWHVAAWVGQVLRVDHEAAIPLASDALVALANGGLIEIVPASGEPAVTPVRLADPLGWELGGRALRAYATEAGVKAYASAVTRPTGNSPEAPRHDPSGGPGPCRR